MSAPFDESWSYRPGPWLLFPLQDTCCPATPLCSYLIKTQQKKTETGGIQQMLIIHILKGKHVGNRHQGLAVQKWIISFLTCCYWKENSDPQMQVEARYAHVQQKQEYLFLQTSHIFPLFSPEHARLPRIMTRWLCSEPACSDGRDIQTCTNHHRSILGGL